MLFNPGPPVKARSSVKEVSVPISPFRAIVAKLGSKDTLKGKIPAGDGETIGLGEGDGWGEGSTEDGEGDAEGEGVTDGLGEGEGIGLIAGLGEGEGVGEIAGEGDGLGDGETPGVEIGEGDGEGGCNTSLVALSSTTRLVVLVMTLPEASTNSNLGMKAALGAKIWVWRTKYKLTGMAIRIITKPIKINTCLLVILVKCWMFGEVLVPKHHFHKTAYKLISIPVPGVESRI